jgi:1,2-phenylacetyl-CoA epoxidase PaaB subunit
MARYLVFGRSEYAQPLRQQGEVEAGDDEEAGGLAIEGFGRDWVELTLLPAASIRWVLEPGGVRTGGRAP